MKTAVILSALVSLASVSEAHESSTVEQTAKNVLSAFQHTSYMEYVSLAPELSQFHQMMSSHSGIYGDFLEEAMKEFDENYEKKFISEVSDSFDQGVSEGEIKGIHWNQIHFVSARRDADVLTIIFSTGGKEYSMRISVLELNGQLNVGRFIELQ